jgi:hypothetical protein
MQPKYLATLIEAIDLWLDKYSDDFVLTPNTADHMANAAAAVLDGMQEASENAEEYTAEELAGK